MFLNAFHMNNGQNPLLKTLLKQEMSSIINIGKYTYGIPPAIRYWGGEYKLEIGKFCSLADGITIFLGGNHDIKAITTSPIELFFTIENVNKSETLSKANSPKITKIGNDVWIGSGATIMSGSVIGDGAVIGARAVVAGKIPPYSVAVGNPARVVKYRFEKEIIDLLLELKWWDWSEEKIKANAINLLSSNYDWLLNMKIEENRILTKVTNMNIPSIIHIGSGKSFRADALNIDINPQWNPDVVRDMAEPLFNEETFDVVTQRFGQISICKNSFERLIAHEVLEHVPNLLPFMKNALDLLEDGGIFDITVPYELSLGAWQDPTHVRAFNENSWLYYTDWFWYLGWDEARFMTEKLEFKLTPYGIELKNSGKSVQEILRTPRAVDGMMVLLKKVPLSDQDRKVLDYHTSRDKNKH